MLSSDVMRSSYEIHHGDLLERIKRSELTSSQQLIFAIHNFVLQINEYIFRIAPQAKYFITRHVRSYIRKISFFLFPSAANIQKLTRRKWR